MLVKFVSEKKEICDEYLDTCSVYAYNTSVHESTSFSLFEVMYGRRTVLRIDIEMNEISHTIIYKNCDVKDSDTTNIMASLTEQRLKILQIAKEYKPLPISHCMFQLLPNMRKSSSLISKKPRTDKNPLMIKNVLAQMHFCCSISLEKRFLKKEESRMEAGTPYIGPYLIIKCHSKGMYWLQLVGDKSSTIERISSAYLKPYKVQHKH